MLDATTASFRDVLKRLVYPVCIVSCKDLNGINYAITVSSVTSVSFDPPSLLVCINSSSSIASVMKKNMKLNISFLNSSQKDIADLCSNPSKKESRFHDQNWEFDHNLNPYVNNAQGVAFCILSKIVDHGTHQVILLNLEDIKLHEGKINPLLYGNQHYLEKFTF